jgi:hypothetical protein
VFCDTYVNDDPQLEGSISSLKNVKDCEAIHEKGQDENEHDDINIGEDDNIE